MWDFNPAEPFSIQMLIKGVAIAMFLGLKLTLICQKIMYPFSKIGKKSFPFPTFNLKSKLRLNFVGL
jgi:hypothetical protein